LTEEQKSLFDEWVLSGKPGHAHEYIGITQAEFEAARNTERARVDAFMKLPPTQSMLATMWARRSEERMRWEDDGGSHWPVRPRSSLR
jgi:hypothetical protein